MTGVSVIIPLLCAFGQAESDRVPTVPFRELSADDRLAVMKQEATEYKLWLEADKPTALVLAEPVLRFNDNVSGVVDALQLIWLREGRPEATASFWRRKDGLVTHEFHSLSEHLVVASRSDRSVWHSQKPGIERTRLTDVPLPAKTAPGRLSQMRAMARALSASVINGSDRIPLRLLPQPIARFGQDDTETLDAGWFVFAKGTNPEVMVLIEARRDYGDYTWHYAPVRMTSRACELKHNDDVVWRVDYDRGLSPDGIYFNIHAQE